MAKKVAGSLRKMQWDYYLLSQRIARIMEQRVLQRFRDAGHRDLSIARLHVLSIILQQHTPITAQLIAEKMGLSAVTVGRLVRALEEGGWIVRRGDPSDGRAYLVEATAKAHAHLVEFRTISDELMDQAYEGVASDDLARWIGHLERIASALSADDDCSES